jgi:hypothetical protein
LSKIAKAMDVHIGELFLKPREGDKPPTTLKAGRKKAR